MATALRMSGVRPAPGALLAVALAWVLRGPPSPAADLAVQGAVIYPGEGHDRF